MRFNATTSIIQNTTANIVGSATAFSIVVWLRALSVGESQGRVLVLDEAGNALSILLVGTDIRFSRAFSGGSAFHDVSTGGWSLNRWVCYALSYTASSGSNPPTVWTSRLGLDGGLVARTVSTTTTTGTATAPNSGFAIGNRSDTARTWDGDQAFMQVFDRAISRQEAEACMLRPGSVRKGRVLWAPLINDPWVYDKNGRRFANTTTAAVTKNGGPPGIVEWGRRARTPGFVPAVGGGGGGPIPVKMFYYRKRRAA